MVWSHLTQGRAAKRERRMAKNESVERGVADGVGERLTFGEKDKGK